MLRSVILKKLLLSYIERRCILHLFQGNKALLKEALRQPRVYGGLWKIIFGGCCYCVLFNHQDSPIANMVWWKYLSVVHVHLVQYNKQQVKT